MASNANCADFDKDNPRKGERLDAIVTPVDVRPMARAIAAYEAQYQGQDLTVAAQVALWLHKGVPSSEISRKFPFSKHDYAIALRILGE